MLCDYSDAHIQVKQAITVIGYGYDDAAKQVDTRNKNAIFKNYAPFRKWISDKNCTDRKY